MSTPLLLRQTLLEQRAFWRNVEFAFFTFALPLLLLLMLGFVQEKDTLMDSDISAVTYIVPGILGFGVISAAFSNLASRIAILRAEGVLKRVRTTPVDAGLYVGAHLLSTLGTTLVVAFATLALGRIVFDVGPTQAGLPSLAIGLVAGIVCFGALGLALSTVIPSAEAAAPISNAVYLPLALVSGVFDPTMTLPGWLQNVVDLFPIRALVELLQNSYDARVSEISWHAVVVLVVWSAVGSAVAVRFFRWQ